MLAPTASFVVNMGGWYPTSRVLNRWWEAETGTPFSEAPFGKFRAILLFIKGGRMARGLFNVMAEGGVACIAALGARALGVPITEPAGAAKRKKENSPAGVALALKDDPTMSRYCNSYAGHHTREQAPAGFMPWATVTMPAGLAIDATRLPDFPGLGIEGRGLWPWALIPVNNFTADDRTAILDSFHGARTTDGHLIEELWPPNPKLSGDVGCDVTHQAVQAARQRPFGRHGIEVSDACPSAAVRDFSRSFDGLGHFTHSRIPDAVTAHLTRALLVMALVTKRNRAALPESPSVRTGARSPGISAACKRAAGGEVRLAFECATELWDSLEPGPQCQTGELDKNPACAHEGQICANDSEVAFQALFESIKTGQ